MKTLKRALFTAANGAIFPALYWIAGNDFERSATMAGVVSLSVALMGLSFIAPIYLDD